MWRCITKLQEIQCYLIFSSQNKPYPKHFVISNHHLKQSNNTNIRFIPIKGTMLERSCHLNIHGTVRKSLLTTPDSNLILIKLDQRPFPREWTSGVQSAKAIRMSYRIYWSKWIPESCRESIKMPDEYQLMGC